MKQSDYISRELSWLEFNDRVLDEAFCATNPLLERVKFLAISASNLDEFFMVRVGGLKMLADAGSGKTDITGSTAAQQLDLIRDKVREMNRKQSKCLTEELEPKLDQAGILRTAPNRLSDQQIQHLKTKFEDEIQSAIAPIAVGAEQKFRMLSGARLCLCVRLAVEPDQMLVPDLHSSATANPDRDRYVVIPLGRSLSRLVAVHSDQNRQYMLLEDVVGMFLPEIFPGQQVIEWTPFRLIRNADLALDDDTIDFVTELRDMLQARKESDCVRLEISSSCSAELSDFLRAAIEVEDSNVYQISGPLDLSDYFGLAEMQGFQHLKNPPWPPQPSPDFVATTDIFANIAAADRLLYHPYQEYDPVIDLLRAAAEDPDVIAIKQTLYRASRNSEVAKALARAAENGKHVTVIVELKARFDEARNIAWAHQLERAGADVIYGVQGLKTHAKACIVVRREPTGIQRYVHFGTGNYNESTARLYSDVSYFTADQQLGTDAIHFFNAVTGLSVPQTLERLSAAPIDLRETLMELIQFEMDNARDGIGGAITAKLNSLVDRQIIDALYEASRAGVMIRLNVRGICCLRPGVAGLSENIEVVSIVDRFLEHARIMHFRHAGQSRMFISSADWMNRNLNRRVELMVPIVDLDCKNRLIRILNAYFEDNVKASRLNSDGSYQRLTPKKGQPKIRVQQRLYDEACELYAAFTNPRTTVFKPHRGESA